jgi:uncharacterized protein DUF4386
MNGRNLGRAAGALYLANSLLSVFNIMVVPNRLLVSGNAAATSANIIASEELFRLGIVSGLASAVTWIFLAYVLHRLFEGISAMQSFLLLCFTLLQVPILFLLELTALAALALLGAPYLQAFDKPQLSSLAMLSLEMHRQGIVLVGVFWGLWLLPFGILLIESRFVPRIIGGLLVAAGVGWVINSGTLLLAPGRAHAVFTVASVLGGLGEGGTILWLLINGAEQTMRPPPAKALVS